MATKVYTDRVVWLKQSESLDSTYSGVEESFRKAGTLWASVETLNAQEQMYHGMRGVIIDVTIRVCNYPAISHKDRLQQGGTVYEIDGITPGDNELVITGRQVRE